MTVHAKPLRHHGNKGPRKNEAIMPLMEPILKSLFDGVDLGLATGPDPALRVAAKYMRFEILRIMARYLLSSMYEAAYTTVPSLLRRCCPPARTMLISKAEDLSDAAYRPFRARSQYNVAGRCSQVPAARNRLQIQWTTFGSASRRQ
jgi:hypothetical protein